MRVETAGMLKLAGVALLLGMTLGCPLVSVDLIEIPDTDEVIPCTPQTGECTGTDRYRWCDTDSTWLEEEQCYFGACMMMGTAPACM